MALGRGVEALFGLKKASTWGTPVLVNNTNLGFRATEWNVELVPENIRDESYNAHPLRRHTTNMGRERVRVRWKMDMKIQGCETMIALHLGTAGTPTTVGSYYRHDIYAKVDMTGIFATLVYYDGITYGQIDSLKIKSLEFEGVAGGIVTLMVEAEGRRLQFDQSSPVANNSLASLTEPTNIDRVPITNSGTSYQIHTHNGTLATFEVNKWKVRFERMLEDDDRAFSSSHAPYRREMAAGISDVTGEMTIPHEATTYITALQAGTLYEIKLNHVLTASEREFGIWLPSVSFAGASFNPQDKAGIPQVLTFHCDKAVSTPTGFAQAVPYVRIFNANSADPLA